MRLRKYGLAAVGVVGATVLLTATPAFAQDTGVAGAGPVDPDQPALGRDRRGARHLHAGRLRAGRDRLLPGQARGARREHELRHLRPGLRRLLPRRLHVHVRRLLVRRRMGYDQADRAARSSAAATGSSSGRATSPSAGSGAYTPGVMAFFLYMVAFMDTTATIPTGAMAERWKWNVVRRLGPVLRRDLLPAVRCLDVGRRLARQLGQERPPRLRLHRLRGLWRRARDGRHRGSRRRPRPRSSHRQVRQGRQAASPRPGHHIPMAMLGTFILLFGWFGFNAASTLSPSTSASQSSRPTPRSPRRSVPSSRCSGSWAVPASPTRG